MCPATSQSKQVDLLTPAQKQGDNSSVRSIEALGKCEGEGDGSVCARPSRSVDCNNSIVWQAQGLNILAKLDRGSWKEEECVRRLWFVVEVRHGVCRAAGCDFERAVSVGWRCCCKRFINNNMRIACTLGTTRLRSCKRAPFNIYSASDLDHSINTTLLQENLTSNYVGHRSYSTECGYPGERESEDFLFISEAAD